MNILHLFSDWKWTGPAEPVLNLCKELESRGHDVTLAYRKPPELAEESFEARIIERKVNATGRFHLDHILKLSRPSSIVKSFRDLSNLTRYLREGHFDIVNVHMSHDHILGGIAARRSRTSVAIIRTDHKRDPLKPSLGNRFLITRLTDGLVTFSERARQEDEKNFGFPSERVARIMPALDLDRFNPNREFKDMRRVFGIKQEETVIGMVARFQKYRRTEMFLEAVNRIVKEFPGVKLLLVGRSSQMEESVVKPVKRLGIERFVVLAGYQREDYVDTLSCMDLFVFLMAGSDGTARALREAMAMGKPAIVSDRGMLPELVDHGTTGWVVKDDPESLANAALKLLRNPEMRASMGRAALEKARRDFRLDRQAEDVEAFYQRMIALAKWKK